MQIGTVTRPKVRQNGTLSDADTDSYSGSICLLAEVSVASDGSRRGQEADFGAQKTSASHLDGYGWVAGRDDRDKRQCCCLDAAESCILERGILKLLEKWRNGS